MGSAILGRKIGMTSYFTEKGEQIPVTVIEAGPCPVVKVNTIERDGYQSVQIGFGTRSEKRVNKPELGHFRKAGIQPTRFLKEFRELDINLKPGDVLYVGDLFKKGDKVKISGTSKGRGFQGVVKRHHFGGVGMTTHGQSDRVRAPGSIGASSFPSRVFKGMRMAGRMGGKRATIRNLEIVDILPEQNLMLVKGGVPGPINGLLEIVKL
ncbi:50S ribosomal protein L3 [Bacteroidetes/Chlorobi group bacterium MS-B_bin-24]|jgi:large subunit ribosomal protein L3|nr:MAG: 50S ribosomal protein L3 [Bacteroidetes/Chlorobi group bacterium MS-B_bin-24]